MRMPLLVSMNLHTRRANCLNGHLALSHHPEPGILLVGKDI